MTTAPFLFSGSPNLTNNDELLAIFSVTFVGGSGHPENHIEMINIHMIINFI